MKITNIILLSFVSLQFCSNKSTDNSLNERSKIQVQSSESTYTSETDDEASDKTIASENKNEIPSPLNKKIIKNADIKIKVKDVKLSTKTIEALTNKYAGYITSSNINSFTNSTDTKIISKDSVLMRIRYTVENNITIRIPTSEFNDFFEEIDKISIFTHFKNISSKDVTEDFIDVTTRLNTKKEVEKRYIEILRTRAKTINDVLATEEKLRVIREEIEAAEGKLRYLSNKVNFSTINLNLYQDSRIRDEIVPKGEETNYKKSFSNKISNGLQGGWQFILYIIIALSFAWPILIVGLIIGFVFYRKMRKK